MLAFANAFTWDGALTIPDCAAFKPATDKIGSKGEFQTSCCAFNTLSLPSGVLLLYCGTGFIPAATIKLLNISGVAAKPAINSSANSNPPSPVAIDWIALSFSSENPATISPALDKILTASAFEVPSVGLTPKVFDQ